MVYVDYPTWMGKGEIEFGTQRQRVQVVRVSAFLELWGRESAVLLETSLTEGKLHNLFEPPHPQL